MPVRISISERDLTSPSVTLSSTDIVFIPGLSALGSDSTTTPEAMVPTLCSTLKEFQDNFGTVAAVFSADQNYPSGSSGFATNAIPGTDPSLWFYGNNNADNSATPDPSYIYAANLLNRGLQVVYCRLNAKSTVTDGIFTGSIADVYSSLTTLFTDSDGMLKSLGDFQFKYLTSGGYPTFEFASSAISKAMTVLAAARGDCLALIDHTDNPSRALTGAASVYTSIQSAGITQGDYGAMYTPWGVYSQTVVTTTSTTMNFPGSFAYLMSLADALSYSANWLVIAGVSRGLVPNLVSLDTTSVLTNAIADKFQQYSSTTSSDLICINAITNIKPYGLCIWGNRTLKQIDGSSNPLKALCFVNLRCLVSDIKKQVYAAAMQLMYEQNTSVLWTNFKSYVTPLLDQMVSGSGLSGYKIIRNTVDSAVKVSASIRIYPVYAVESFDITIQITDDESVAIV